MNKDLIWTRTCQLHVSNNLQIWNDWPICGGEIVDIETMTDVFGLHNIWYT